MNAKPKLFDLPATRTHYNAGDKIVVRVASQLSPDQQKNLINAVKKYCQAEVSVLVVNCLETWLIWYDASQQKNISIAGPEHVDRIGIENGIVSIDCSKTEFDRGDKLTLVCQFPIKSQLQKNNLYTSLQRWAGLDVEVVIIG